MNIDINGVSITLTKEQLEKISKELEIKKYTHYTDIKSLEDAVNFTQATFAGQKIDESSPTIFKIQTISKAINLLNNIKPKYNHYPYFEKNSNGVVGFRFSFVGYCVSTGQVAFLKCEESSNYMGRTFFKYYQDLYNETKVI